MGQILASDRHRQLLLTSLRIAPTLELHWCKNGICTNASGSTFGDCFANGDTIFQKKLKHYLMLSGCILTVANPAAQSNNIQFALQLTCICFLMSQIPTCVLWSAYLCSHTFRSQQPVKPHTSMALHLQPQCIQLLISATLAARKWRNTDHHSNDAEGRMAPGQKAQTMPLTKI